MNKKTSWLVLDTTGIATTIDDVKVSFRNLFRGVPTHDRSSYVADAVSSVWEKISGLAGIRKSKLDEIVATTANSVSQSNDNDNALATSEDLPEPTTKGFSSNNAELPEFMNELDPNLCDALRMKLQGKTLEFIAKELNVSTSTAGRWVNKAAGIYYRGQEDA